ncbi:DEAD/DEAH box helicase, partial [uncultured Sphingomonas sp.]|uniref:DEAD/DEAH box helicase n=1 Tax=uncultured Sphingomonas sp. TaxID=158754 RepID=UPI0035C9DC48
PDIEEICTKLPKQRQTLLFSATMPPPIKKLADKFLDNPKTIEVSRPASTSLNITQALVPVSGGAFGKRERLRSLLGQPEVTTAIIFCNRKTTVRELNKSLQGSGFRSSEIHGDMEQQERLRELDRFKTGEVNILVASDVAARGLDIKGVSHVFNFDAPWHPDDYVHRIGRTGRAGATGTAYTLVAAEDEENIANIEKLTGQTIARLPAQAPAPAPARESRRERETPPARAGRRDREAPPAREVPPAREERPAQPARRDEPRREPRQEEPRRETRQADAPRRDTRQREGRDDGPDVGWNGPIPEFLSATLSY